MKFGEVSNIISIMFFAFLEVSIQRKHVALAVCKDAALARGLGLQLARQRLMCGCLVGSYAVIVAQFWPELHTL